MAEQQSYQDATGFTSISQGFEACMKQAEQLMKSFTDQSGQQDWDPLKMGPVYAQLLMQMNQDPQKLLQANIEYWKQNIELYQQGIQSMLTQKPMEPVATEESDDRRFRHEGWQQPAFDLIKQSYLLMSQHLRRLVQETEGLDDRTAERAAFFTELYLDALSPSNFIATNPAVLEKIQQTAGMSLVNGMQNMIKDLQRGEGKLAISMTDYQAFELGKNVATTPGKVVFENRMFQLIQYSPATDQVNQTPLLVIPPWINKFYILDLQQKNSLINWLVQQGHSVFVISWVNPDQSYADVGFEEYMSEGVLTAIDQIEQATGEQAINAIGYCIGGTLLGITLAYMAAQDDQRIKSASFLTSMLDFTEPGELGMFIDEAQLESLEQKMEQDGYLDGGSMSGTFNLLRANDLIWSFYINNYLLGNDPRPFDLLYWNSDSTRMPAKMHKWYLRNLYLHNNLVKPGKLVIKDTPIDLGEIKTPSIFISTVDDHIAPWKSTWMGAQKLGGPVKFILGGSGHVAGVVNPPDANKYGYRMTAAKLPKDAEAWAAKAKQHEGSWWLPWNKWVAKYAGDKVAARTPGDNNLEVIEDAPGRYVKTKIVNI